MNRTKVLHMIFIFLLFITPKYFSQNASFRGLGDLPGGVFESSAQSVNADGSVIVGSSMSDSGTQAFIWSEITGMVSLGNLPDSSFLQSWANIISADGKVIVGYGDPVGSGWDTYKGFIWTAEGGMREMGSLNNSERFMAFNVSGDGSVVVGDGGPEAFRWTQETGIEGLGVLPGKTNSRAIDISTDGSVIIGQSYSLPAWNDEDGFIWTQSGGMKSMASLTGGKYCMLLAVSPDGSVIAGTTRSSSTSYPAFYWTEDKGMVVLGHLPGRNTTHPTDMTPLGKIIVGGSFSGPTSGDAFIWDSTNGMRKLQTVLQTEYGLNLTGWTLQNASSITPDGNIIIGHGINPSGKKEAFRVVLDTLISNKYLGQVPPGNTAEIFAAGIVSNANSHSRIVVSPDGKEIFWNVADFTTWETKIYCAEYKCGKWSNPQVPSFAAKGSTSELVFAPDGKKLFFTYRDNVNSKWTIKYVVKTDSGWSEPKGDGFLLNPSSSFTTTGRVYFSDALAGLPWNGIYSAHYSETGLSDIKPLPEIINTPDIITYTPYIAPDESFLLFSSNRPVTGGEDTNMYLYISFNNNGEWTSPQKINDAINFSGKARLPSISPDGKYLFFCGDDRNYYWVAIKALNGINPTGVNKSDILPQGFNLYQNYPNPFNPSTNISYQLPESCNVTLKIYDVLGREIKSLKDDFQNTGKYSIVWDATDNLNHPVSSGVYFYSLVSNDTRIHKKMILIR